jgi:hypothetical protein
MLGSQAQAKAASSDVSFDDGYKKYMAANCTEAMEPLYQSSLQEFENKDRALLYLAHCQSIFGRTLDAAYNLDRIKAKNLKKDDQKLYKDLASKHNKEMNALHKLYFNLTPYAGQGSASPKTVKGDASYSGFSLGVSRPTWSVGAFYESYSQKMVPTTYKTYSQTMMGAQLGYFILPTWRVSGSYTNIHGSNDQLNSVSAMGVQTDYYFMPAWSLFLEYYASNYPKLLANKVGTYLYPVSASEMVVGLGFPLFNGDGFGINGSANYSTVSLTKSNDTEAVANVNLAKNTGRSEVVLSTYAGKANAALTYWAGTEVLGVRSRGSVVMDSTDLHKGGSKLSLGYTFNAHFGVGAAYGVETYTAANVAGTYEDFQSSSTTGMLIVNW